MNIMKSINMTICEYLEFISKTSSVRLQNCLQNDMIDNNLSNTPAIEYLSRADRDFRKIKNFGKKSLSEIDFLLDRDFKTNRNLSQSEMRKSFINQLDGIYKQIDDVSHELLELKERINSIKQSLRRCG